MDTDVIITCILSSSLAAALLTSLKEVFLWKMNRKAKLEDDGEETKKKNYDHRFEDIKTQLKSQESTDNRILEILSKLEDKLDINMESSRLILKDRIKFIALNYIKRGSISFDDRKNVHEMWKLYHFGLGGNGDLDPVMTQLDALPLEIEEDEVRL